MTAAAFSAICAGGERAFADADSDVGCFVHLELHATGLHSLDRPDNVVGNGTRLGIRHQAFGTQYTGEGTNLLHRFRGGDGDIEIEPAFVDLLHHVLQAGVIGARLERGVRVIGEDEDSDFLARTIRQRRGTAHHLITLGGVDT